MKIAFVWLLFPYFSSDSDIENNNENEDEEDVDEDFSFLDETDYVIYEDCYESADSEESWEECDKAYKFGGKDYYDYEETLKDFNTTKNSKKSSPTPDEKSSKQGK